MRALVVLLTLALSWASGASADVRVCPSSSELAGVYKSSQGQVRLFTQGKDLVGDFKFPKADGYIEVKYPKRVEDCKDAKATFRIKGSNMEGTVTLSLDNNTITMKFTIDGETETFVGRR